MGTDINMWPHTHLHTPLHTRAGPGGTRGDSDGSSRDNLLTHGFTFLSSFRRWVLGVKGR